MGRNGVTLDAVILVLSGQKKRTSVSSLVTTPERHFTCGSHLLNGYEKLREKFRRQVFSFFGEIRYNEMGYRHHNLQIPKGINPMSDTEVTLSANDYKAVIKYLNYLAHYAARVSSYLGKKPDHIDHENIQRIIRKLEKIDPDGSADYVIRRA